MPPGRSIADRSPAGEPMALIVIASAEGYAVDLDRARSEHGDRAGGDPHVVDGDRLRARIAQLVDEVVHGGRVERAVDLDGDPLALDSAQAGEGGQIRRRPPAVSSSTDWPCSSARS